MDTIRQMKHMLASAVSTLSVLAIWPAIIALFASNLAAGPFATGANPKFTADLISSPLSIRAHETAATVYLTHNRNELAAAELSLAQTLRRGISSDVLGDFQQREELYTQKLNEWSMVISQKPDYRDAYINAAYYSLMLQDINEAHRYLERASKLDPNNPTISTIMKALQASEMKR